MINERVGEESDHKRPESSPEKKKKKKRKTQENTPVKFNCGGFYLTSTSPRIHLAPVADKDGAQYQRKWSKLQPSTKTVMKARACLRRECGAIFLFLTVFVCLFLLRNMDVLKILHKVNSTSTIPYPRAATDPHIHHGFCTFPPLFPEDALEERQILDSIAWPETPLSTVHLSVEHTSSAPRSTFTILPGRAGGRWCVGDQLDVRIKMSDTKGRPKKSGGDFLLARLYNQKLGAGVAGQVVDHFNGSYSAAFPLLWEGGAQVQVLLVNPLEAIPVMSRLNREQPDRILFKSLFRSGRVSETSICNICLRPTRPLCNYTDHRTGEPWFCYKPKKLGCDARITHTMDSVTTNLKANENKFFHSGVNLKVSIPASGPAGVTVLPRKEEVKEVKSRTVTPGPSGYYYHNMWRALDGTTVRQFNVSTINQCLRGKAVLIFGDSTVRQYYQYLITVLPDLKEFDLHTPRGNGPYISLDYANNIRVSFRFHSTPIIRLAPISTCALSYIANELEGVIGGGDTVVVIGLWAHFSVYPMAIYIRRLQNIRRAVVRLLDRAPRTLVVIRNGNPKAQTIHFTNSDWHALQFNKVLRAIFKGLNVHLIDAWEMVLASNLSHNLHPPRPIIKNMINVLLSYICPLKGG